MNDTISRIRLLNRLKHRRDAFCKNRIKFLGLSKNDKARVDEMDKCIAEVINAPSAQPEQRWIPCSERLPERGKDVLVTRDYDGREDSNKSCRYVEVAGCFGEDDDISWCSLSDEYKMRPKNHHVIAWMPLPEPYAERNTDETD